MEVVRDRRCTPDIVHKWNVTPGIKNRGQSQSKERFLCAKLEIGVNVIIMM